MTKILVISTSYPSNHFDWRGVFIRHLVNALARRIDLQVQLWAPPGDVSPRVEPVATREERQWLSDMAKAGGVAHVIRSRSIRSLSTPIALTRKLRAAYLRSTADVYHVNWLQNALAVPNNGIPLLVAVLGTDFQLLRLPMMRGLLVRAFRNRRVVICPNAGWMVPELTRAFGHVAEVRSVPFGIDPAWFRVERFDTLDNRPRPWLCVTRVTRAKLGHLMDWGEAAFKSQERELHLLGPMQESIKLPAWIHYHGPTNAEELRQAWFPKAQGLITLSSHAEGRPQIMLEAMAAALPVVATVIPAHVDIIDHGRNGFLCDSPGEVTRAISALDDMKTNNTMGLLGRQQVADEMGTWDDCAGRYVDEYQRLLWL